MGLKRIGQNKWRADWRDEFGARREQTWVGPYAKEDAEEFYYYEQSRVKKAKNGMPGAKRVEYVRFRDEWLRKFKIQAESRQKINTYNDYVSIFKKHIDPLFAELKFMSDIKPSFISDLKIELLAKKVDGKYTRIERSDGRFDIGREKKSISPKTVRNILTPLQSMLKDAFIQEATDKDLSLYIKKPSAKSMMETHPLTEQEVAQFLATVDKKWKLFFALAFWTGARTGELLALQFDDFDIHRNHIHIRRSFSRGVLTTPKTGVARTIDLLPEARRFMLNWKHELGQYVFCKENGDELERNNIRNRIWAKTLTRIGLAYRRLYETRHTFGSNMMARGEDPLWVANMMGDNVQTVFKHYAKYRDKSASRLAPVEEKKA